MTNIISDYLPIIFKGVKPGWKKILFSPEIKPIMNQCFRDLNNFLVEKKINHELELGNYIRPKPELILESFRYFEPEQLRVIIIGQDPYPKPENASGLSFSVPENSPIPKSLKNIYQCLVNTGVLKELPKTGNLKQWAKQGVLLLNRYLTRSPTITNGNIEGNGNSESENLHRFWGNFTTNLIQFILDPEKVGGLNFKLQPEINILLWGKIAQELELFINPNPKHVRVNIRTWNHPVSLIPESNPNHFIHCDHFKKIPEINWNPEIETESKKLGSIILGIDGGCRGNGKIGARASWGFYIPEKFKNKPNGISKSDSGLVPGFKLRKQGMDLIICPEIQKPTNNRAELLAFIKVLIYLFQFSRIEKIIISSDSRYVSQLVNIRIWKYLKQDPELNNVELNRDLILIIRDLLLDLPKLFNLEIINGDFENIWEKLIPEPLRSENPKKIDLDNLDQYPNGLIVIHQNSHLTPNEKKKITSEAEIEFYILNEKADKLCSILLE